MANVLRTTLVALVFAFLTFIALELSLRVYLFGPTGFSPTKVGSFSLIFDSGLVQPASNREIWYELKPDQKALFRGVLFETNSQGLADQEYSLEKPANTVRVALVGSSWTMGSGVLADEVYHSLLEKEFSSASSATRFEFINFGVEYYGLQEIIATARYKALRYDPDLILLEITESTPTSLWVPRQKDFVPLPVRNRAWDSILLMRLEAMLGIKQDEADESKDYVTTLPADDYKAYFGQIARALTELGEIGRANGIPVAATWLRVTAKPNDRMATMFLRRAAKEGVYGSVVDLNSLLKPGEDRLDLLVSRVEPHPNAYGHQLIAAELRRQLFAAHDVLPRKAQP